MRLFALDPPSVNENRAKDNSFINMNRFLLISCFPCSVRKNADDLKEALQKVLAPMFCNAMTVASEDQKSKLDKVMFGTDVKCFIMARIT